MSGTQRYRVAANWKFVTDNQGDGYHPAYSHRSLLMMAASRYGDKDMQYFAADPDASDMFVKGFRNGHHYLDQRPEMHKVSGWEQQRPQPGREHLEQSLPEKYGETEAKRLLELAVGAGLNLTVFPNLLIDRQPDTVGRPAGRGRDRSLLVCDDRLQPAGRGEYDAHAHPGGFSHVRRGG